MSHSYSTRVILEPGAQRDLQIIPTSGMEGSTSSVPRYVHGKCMAPYWDVEHGVEICIPEALAVEAGNIAIEMVE